MNYKNEIYSDLELKPTFITLLSPEILLAHLDINNNDWLTYGSDWFYKIEKKDIASPFQRILHITNKLKNIEIYNNYQVSFQALHSHQHPPSISIEQSQLTEKIIRAILNLEQSTPIENLTEDTENRTNIEDIIASLHLKILSLT
ncbi:MULTISPECIES: DUF6367 family protein [Acinetobacter]|uniref:DUF6367 family protein n=1 Tax=Acinetobacter TaxID=469 RepID=UPI00125EA9CD|nr:MULTISPECIES: DUF6367 family protein [Acinetobacter]MBJ8453897.1 hypothetical protein [Acinetobacter bereziniae]MBJ8458055.1 hypothetical protein [Acinetobacter bereziniae]MCU4316975.1 hypothetical protein [Acinetobacter bereziniae]BCX73157.1 hypothetical protein TOL5_13570 [Acinetobacter sp. Tol 5]